MKTDKNMENLAQVIVFVGFLVCISYGQYLLALVGPITYILLIKNFTQ